jgi:hypothetical protein
LIETGLQRSSNTARPWRDIVGLFRRADDGSAANVDIVVRGRQAGGRVGGLAGEPKEVWEGNKVLRRLWRNEAGNNVCVGYVVKSG